MWIDKRRMEKLEARVQELEAGQKRLEAGSVIYVPEKVAGLFLMHSWWQPKYAPIADVVKAIADHLGLDIGVTPKSETPERVTLEKRQKK